MAQTLDDGSIVCEQEHAPARKPSCRGIHAAVRKGFLAEGAGCAACVERGAWPKVIRMECRGARQTSRLLTGWQSVDGCPGDCIFHESASS